MMKKIPLLLLAAASFASSEIPYSIIVVIDNTTDYTLKSDISSTEPAALEFHGSENVIVEKNETIPYIFDHTDNFSVSLSNLVLEGEEEDTSIPCTPNIINLNAKMPTRITNLYVTHNKKTGCNIEIIS